MKILICPDKFKGSLDARQVCDAITRGIHSIQPDSSIEAIPLADGGEGTCALLTEWNEGKKMTVQVHGPLFREVTAKYGLSNDGQTAFIEMAEASGLTLLSESERDPLLTTSLGTGELISNALDQGVSQVILGIGGSATNDAGMGMASGLGYKFYGADKELLKPIGENLIHLRYINSDGIHPRLNKVKFIVLCDVTNPLYGPEGAAYVYGPQKGADGVAIDLLDAGLRNFRRVIQRYSRVSVDFPGAGAAGGMGAGGKVFLNASIQKGINYVIEHTGLEEKVRQADVIITGEGRIDKQTFSGKVVHAIIKLADKAEKPVIIVCGICELSESEKKILGVKRIISLVDDDITPESAIQNAAAIITRKVTEECKKLPVFN